jgi:hypothetical protein
MRMVVAPELVETEATVVPPIEDWNAINWRKLEQWCSASNDASTEPNNVAMSWQSRVSNDCS